jgi:hypothetical protein
MEARPVALKQYLAATGSRFSEEDARVLGPELERLAARHHPTLSDVVHAASDRRSPLYRFFEWDNTEASRLWRLRQAAEMVGAVRVAVVAPDGRREVRPAFVCVPVATRPSLPDAPARRSPLSRGNGASAGLNGNGASHPLPVAPSSRAGLPDEDHAAAALDPLLAWRRRWERRRATDPAFRQRFQRVFDAIDAAATEELPAAGAPVRWPAASSAATLMTGTAAP